MKNHLIFLLIAFLAIVVVIGTPLVRDITFYNSLEQKLSREEQALDQQIEDLNYLTDEISHWYRQRSLRLDTLTARVLLLSAEIDAYIINEGNDTVTVSIPSGLTIPHTNEKQEFEMPAGRQNLH